MLYLHAALWAVGGAALTVFPRIVLVNLFNQVAYGDYAWVRIVGLQAVGLAMLMVLVAHRAEDVWWWSWAFVIPTGLIAVVAALNASISLPELSSSVLWWLLAGISTALVAGLFLGLARTSRERPLP
jgi:hypothetical protein